MLLRNRPRVGRAVGTWLSSNSELMVVKRLCSVYSDDQDEAPPHHDSGGTPCASVSVGSEALAVRELESQQRHGSQTGHTAAQNHRLPHWLS